MAYNPLLPAGQATMANSSPVAIASDQSVIPVSGTFWQATQPVSIASSVAVTGPLTDTELRASAVPVSLASLPSLAAGSNTIGSIANTSFASTQSGTWSTRTQDGSGNAITSTSNALDVNVKNSSIAVTGTFYQATQPVSGTVTANISGSISNTSFDATQGSAANLKNQPHVLVSASQPSYSDTDVAPMSLTTAGNLRVDGSSVTQPVSGTVTISSGTISVSQSTAANLKAQAESYQGGSAVSSSNPLYVAQLPVTSGGVVPVTGSSVGGTSAITLYSSPGQVYGWYFYNAGTNAGYIFFYDTGSAITVGTTTPYYVLVIPPTSGANVFGIGITHTNSIKIGISQGRSSGTALSTALDYTIFYK
jgi:hypothetical protein